jgi:hypothetical protein
MKSMFYERQQQDPTVSHHLGAIRIGLASIPHSQMLAPIFLFFKKFEQPQRLHTKDYQRSQGHSA